MIDSLSDKICSSFNVIASVDAGDITSAKGSIYKFLHDNNQESFEPLDRIVIYSSRFLGKEFVEELYHAAETIDITPYFILICGNPKNKPLIQHCANSNDSWNWFSFEKQIFKTETKPIYFTALDQNTLCPLPWSHLEIKNNGSIAPCCVNNDNLGNVVNTTINDAFYSKKMQMLRESMLNGERPESCKHCWRLDDNNLTSSRVRHLEFYKKQFLTKYVHNPGISSLDIKPGNLCNFKCRICNTEASSSHIKEQNQFRTIPLSPSNWAESESLLTSDILELNDQLQNLDFYGGEPFLVKSLTKLVEKLSKTKNVENIRLHYNTNGSVFPEFLVDYWKKFKEINIMFSIDDIGDRFEIQRGGNWNSVDKNIEKFCDLDLDNLDLGVMPTINVMNILYINEVMEWADEKNLTVHFNYLKGPIGYSLNQLTRSAKDSIFKKYHNTKYTEIENLMRDIDDMPDGDGKEFLKITNYYDNIRSENFYTSHSEIFTAMSS